VNKLDKTLNWSRDGFAVLGPLVTDAAELAQLVQIVDDLVGEAAGQRPEVRDLVGAGGGPARVAQVVAPAQLRPELADLPLMDRARTLIADFFGPNVRTELAMIIAKPARDGGEVPWHQDAAYWERGVRHRAGSIWIALQDVDVANGCLHFVPGSHRLDVVEHEPIAADATSHGLQLRPEALNEFVIDPVAVPLLAGHATLHDGYTLHHSGENQTEGVRRALVLSVRDSPAI
jgi:hypothetical protein